MYRLQDNKPPYRVQRVISTLPDSFKFEQLPDLVSAFKLTQMSDVLWYDRTQHHWISLKISVPISNLNTAFSLLFRVQAEPDPFKVWTDTPDVQGELRLQHKRRRSDSPPPSDACAPPSKMIRVDPQPAVASSSQSTSHISLPRLRAQPPPGSTTISERPLNAIPDPLPESVPTAELRPTTSTSPRLWPNAYSVSEIAQGLQDMEQLVQSGTSSSRTHKHGRARRMTQAEAFLEVFGSALKRNTWKRNISDMWLLAPRELRDMYIKYGTHEAGTWSNFRRSFKYWGDNNHTLPSLHSDFRTGEEGAPPSQGPHSASVDDDDLMPSASSSVPPSPGPSSPTTPRAITPVPLSLNRRTP